jgi:hypothetical protein
MTRKCDNHDIVLAPYLPVFFDEVKITHNPSEWTMALDYVYVVFLEAFYKYSIPTESSVINSEITYRHTFLHQKYMLLGAQRANGAFLRFGSYDEVSSCE